MAKKWRKPNGPRKESAGRREAREIAHLGERTEKEKPQTGAVPGKDVGVQGGEGMATATRFEELPLSKGTLDGLKSCGFEEMTAVQRAAIPHALAGRDVLGAAKTGSGKTLAFLVPAFERLYRQQWTSMDGLGALFITPTRELALQIFSNVRDVGKNHPFSGALLIGGSHVETEKKRVAGVNMLVCTPGRLLQHMDETPNFDAGFLQVLIIDEADRTLDMGFKATLDAIIENLPRKGRQAMLFSATQSKQVSGLARLSLNKPEFISVHAESGASTPKRLEQLYTECHLFDKLELLWSFIKSHLGSKILVFLSTCRQVQFVHEAFRQLRPGTPLRCIHGRVKQKRRLVVYDEFCKAKNMVLFATDVAARGLDFPAVDWVVQADCPDGPTNYIHRVGRTARFKNSGRALLLVLPSEQAIIPKLQEARVPLKRVSMNNKKRQPISSALRTLLSKDNQLKHYAQKAVSSYLRGVAMASDKSIFDVFSLPIEEFAASFGLPNPPRLRFLDNRRRKALPTNGSGGEENEEEEEESEGDDPPGDNGNASEAAPAKANRLAEMADYGANALREGAAKMTLAMDSDDEEEDEEDNHGHNDNHEQSQRGSDGANDLLRAKQGGTVAEQLKPDTPAKPPRRLKIKAGGVANAAGTKKVFNEQGEPVPPLSRVSAEEQREKGEYAKEAASRFERIAREREAMDPEDRARERERVKEKRRRLREKQRREDDMEAPPADRGASLAETEVANGGEEKEVESESEQQPPASGRGEADTPEPPTKRKRSLEEIGHKGMGGKQRGLTSLEAKALARLRSS